MAFPKKIPGSRLHLDIANQKKRRYITGAPTGITVHYSADVRLSSVINSLEARSLGYHLAIERDGAIVQLTRLDRSVAHAGKALWNGESPNQNHLAVCLLSWGWLKKHKEDYVSWSGALVYEKDVVQRPDILGNATYWHKATPEQYKTLIEVCLWGVAHGIKYENICGHDEAALPLGRKQDPGGILPCTMKDFRQKLFDVLKEKTT